MIGAISALTLAAVAVVGTGVITMSKPDAISSNNLETLVVPTKQNEYFRQDIRFKITLPEVYLHQKDETWSPPLNGISFALDLNDDSATPLTPIEHPSIVVVRLSVVYYDSVDSQVRNFIRIREEDKGSRRDGEISSRQHGLNYFTTIEYPGAPPTEFLFDEPPFYRTMINCRPSGNSYASLCTLQSIGERGGGINPQANAAIMTEITFRQDKMPEWNAIRENVERFLRGKVTVIGWGN